MNREIQAAIVSFLRTKMEQSGLNTAALAKAADLKRTEVRKLLAAREEITLSQLVALSSALGVDMASLPWAGDSSGATDSVAVMKTGIGGRSHMKEVFENAPVMVDPFGIQGEQAFRLAFGLGVDFIFVAKTEHLEDSGIPEEVLAKSPNEIVLRLDAAFHRHNDPQFTPDGVCLVLSFDTLYTCRLPWSSITKVVFQLDPIEPLPEPPSEPDADVAKTFGPGLRLLKG